MALEKIIITDEEKELMIHALGLERSKKAYRNYFNTGKEGVHFEIWQGLTGKGYAVNLGSGMSRGVYFKITENGLRALGLPQKTIDEALES